MMDETKEAQEREYIFPYHYIAQFQNGFKHCIYDTWGINYAATLEYLLERLSNESFGNIVDIGCGDGRLIFELARRFPDVTATGLDYSERAITLARAMNPDGDYRAVDIKRQSINERYEIALLIEVFEHIHPAETDPFLEAITRLLRPGGLLYLTVPHINKPVEYHHYRHFASGQIVGCLEPYFSIQELVPFEWTNWRMRIIDRLLCNRLFILNHQQTRQYLYTYYKKHAFGIRSEDECQRLFIRAEVKS